MSGFAGKGVHVSESVDPSVFMFIGPKNKSKSRSRSRDQAASKIQRFYKRKTRKSILKNVGNLNRIVKNYSSRRISTFFRNNPNVSEKVARTLHGVCASSGFCLAIGADQINRINHFFKHFSTFEYLSSIRKIGIPSLNGFINELKYEREGYSAYAILKSSKSETADNLMYEYWVGQFINIQNRRFPCFLETYGLYVSKGEHGASRQTLEQFNEAEPTTISSVEMNGLIDPITIPDPKMPLDLDWNIACRSSDSLHLLIQQIPMSFRINDILDLHLPEQAENRDFFQEIHDDDFGYLLYQVYKPLSMLARIFTHYDLHCGNVLVYCPDRTKYIHYQYVLEDGTTVEFYSPFVVKIIDYGRCYVDHENRKSSFNLQPILCNSAFFPNCNQKRSVEKLPNDICGYRKGFSFFVDPSPTLLHSNRLNKSHDLKLANFCKFYYSPTLDSSEAPLTKHGSLLKSLLYKVQYGLGIRTYTIPRDATQKNRDEMETYNKNIVFEGTDENINVSDPTKIFNVMAMANALELFIRDSNIKDQNDRKYSNTGKYSKLGTLTVYCDRSNKSMTYTSS